jgi:hypothetical protein
VRNHQFLGDEANVELQGDFRPRERYQKVSSFLVKTMSSYLIRQLALSLSSYR